MLIGAEHREHGAMLFRTVACLPLLTGAWRDRGGGFARSVGTWFSVGIDEAAVYGPSLATPGSGSTRQINTNQLGRTLTDPDLDPPVTVLVAWNGNPMVSVPEHRADPPGPRPRRPVHRGPRAVHDRHRALRRRRAAGDDAAGADRRGRQRGGTSTSDGTRPRSSRGAKRSSNTELFRRLSHGLGFDDPELQRERRVADRGRPRAARRATRGPRCDATGFVRLPLPEDLRPYADGGFATPDGKAMLFDGSRRGRGPLPD